ncbi:MULTISPECIES: hypothetical protein [unclassified Mesorhizobium]|uniref:hypothetical protein n=1 Tax=unclassified Mesorhizobium TaxID=325217 RepID=UPI00112C77B7|nr:MULTISPECIES: hypothetical protein [unclassified Mesorhizobium]TPL04152.1 hypothetical protein FJ567_04570 [Mesorhizobium sp. B2-4-16]TPL76348.1 hypothetical protein FJ956_04495 [Mesorhizobium sp. B2-4-3]
MISAISASAVVATMRLVEPFAASNSLTARTFFWHGQKHAPKEKDGGANKYRQQNSEMYPTGLGHPVSPLFPSLGREFNSTERT